MGELSTVDVSFTLLELLYIDDNLTPEIVDTSQTNRPQFSSGAIGTTRSLIFKIGDGILDLTESNESDIIVSLIEDELWTLREMAISSIVVGSERVGLSIKTKIYQSFRDYAALGVLQDFWIAAAEDVPDDINVIEKLKSFEESQNASTDTD